MPVPVPRALWHTFSRSLKSAKTLSRSCFSSAWEMLPVLSASTVANNSSSRARRFRRFSSSSAGPASVFAYCSRPQGGGGGGARPVAEEGGGGGLRAPAAEVGRGRDAFARSARQTWAQGLLLDQRQCDRCCQTPVDHRGGKRSLPSGKSERALCGTHTFGSQTPPQKYWKGGAGGLGPKRLPQNGRIRVSQRHISFCPAMVPLVWGGGGGYPPPPPHMPCSAPNLRPLRRALYPTGALGPGLGALPPACAIVVVVWRVTCGLICGRGMDATGGGGGGGCPTLSLGPLSRHLTSGLNAQSPPFPSFDVNTDHRGAEGVRWGGGGGRSGPLSRPPALGVAPMTRAPEGPAGERRRGGGQGGPGYPHMYIPQNDPHDA